MSIFDILPTGSTEGRLLHVGKMSKIDILSYMKKPPFGAFRSKGGFAAFARPGLPADRTGCGNPVRVENRLISIRSPFGG
jgi:hypothetical protein